MDAIIVAVKFAQCEVESDGVREKKGLFKIK